MNGLKYRRFVKKLPHARGLPPKTRWWRCRSTCRRSCIATPTPVRFRQLLENVLTNALKFTPCGGTVVIEGREDAGQIIIEVADSGIGLSEVDKSSIFHPFWQADTSPSRKYSGTGIGLTVVKELVALHGGEIHVDSAGLNKGTCFTIALPKRGFRL